MRLSWAVAAVLVTTSELGGETVCMNSGARAAATYRGRAIATGILKTAGVVVEFKDDERWCTEPGNTIVITLSDRTPADAHPGALAYAMPFERTRIVVFYDRVLATARPAGVPSLLGHVLAHEIAHMFQAVEHHSPTGVMKGKWDYRDYVEMQRHPLGFTEEDLLLIRQGLKKRASGAASASSLK